MVGRWVKSGECVVCGENFSPQVQHGLLSRDASNMTWSSVAMQQHQYDLPAPLTTVAFRSHRLTASSPKFVVTYTTNVPPPDDQTRSRTLVMWMSCFGVDVLGYPGSTHDTRDGRAMPSFMIGDILEQKSKLQSPLGDDGGTPRGCTPTWHLSPPKELSPMDLCTRLPFTVTALGNWLPNQPLPPDLTRGLRLTPQDSVRLEDGEFAGCSVSRAQRVPWVDQSAAIGMRLNSQMARRRQSVKTNDPLVVDSTSYIAELTVVTKHCTSLKSSAKSPTGSGFASINRFVCRNQTAE
ncbi:unnamed protein product [Mesocestoides corti]|uniref:Uncharacterized protein n=1 Tax=Mesocestoides corti TaxID=53468 RepID=A0A0R3UIU4_MESCO|nr:unnamed protein product [Mesocestoides corti]